jgi:hypothetical protein
MAISITLTLPDEIFNLAQSLAHSINRDLNDILVEASAFSISPNYQGEKISSLNSLSDEEIIKLTQLQREQVKAEEQINYLTKASIGYGIEKRVGKRQK